MQRWHDQRDSYRPAGELIDASRYGVELLDSDKVARAFVCRHHYSGSFPAARLRVGLYRLRHLVGVAVFSVPMNSRTLRAYGAEQPNQGVELGRFVLLDDVPANGETWFLARAFRLLRREKPEVRLVLSYSDPVPRMTTAGHMVLPGHVGTIYQAHNGRYVGRASATRLVLGPDGRVISRRALSKIRNGERGAAYVYRMLRAMGAPAMTRGENPRAYVKRALAEGPFRVVRHPGNHAYVWAFDRATLHRLPQAEQYPKLREAA